jgi:simple sugar transport system ATP-binding protein
VRAGEIVGLAGVDGSGQRELIEAVAGLRRSDRGEVSLNGIDISDWSIEARRNAGIAYIPEDRHQRALVLSFSCEENMILGRQRETTFSRKSGILNKTAIQAFFADRIAAYDVRGAEIGVPVRSLSGGNQQKLVLARELSRDLSLVAVMQPTRGLDFAAAAFVHNALRRERDRGVAVLFQSLDLQEILALSDRIAVMLSGRIVAILSRQEANETLLGQLMTGVVAS